MDGRKDRINGITEETKGNRSGVLAKLGEAIDN